VRAAGGAEESRLYDDGARAFEGGDLEEAARRFKAVLALPAELRRHRSTWAAYMLGRLLGGRDAIAAYAQVRALVADGFLDERGLAASSLGQEARLHLDAGDLVTAVRLYAEQAALGHPDGTSSLLFVVRDAIARHAEGALVADALGQRLLGAYLFTRDNELTDELRDRLWRELGALDAVSGADRLAAAAYRAGRWQLAGELAGRDPDAALSRWVRAKLALRAGDPATAERLLDQVAGQLTADAARCGTADDAGEVDSAALDRAQGERATLALFDGRPVDAMALVWQARNHYPLDAIHVAERVLTIDELRAFIDAAPAVDAVPYDPEVPDWWTVSPAALRDLLARRLMRAGRYDEALPYFTADNRADAVQFASAMRRADTGADVIDRAQALYEASLVARRHGLEILGTEHTPDWGTADAQFDLADYDIVGGWPSAEPAPWVSAVERARIADSSPSPARRYHYRYLASALAEQAADLLPHQSQAFAAVLCHATRYVFDDDRARVHALYRRYVHDGASVDFSGTFGVTCPEPEFERARRYLPRRSAPRWPVAIVLGVVVIALACLAHRRRRQIPAMP
jgi:hypothetical protein